MRAVKGRDTAPEIAVRKLLHRLGYRFRLHDTRLPGSPDIVFPGRRLVVFVHGCFWHGHRCKRGARVPATNTGYWISKIARNRARDVKVRRKLKAAGWGVLTVWECQLRRPTLAARIKRFLKGGTAKRNLTR
jgi:DNA mismatch endonuclease (patch repair protein)